MSVARTPPSGSQKSTPVHYGSDSALHCRDNQDKSDFTINRRFKRRLDDPSDCNTNITLSELKYMFEDWQNQQEAKFVTLKSSMDAIIKQNEEIKSSMKLLSDKYDDILSDMKKLRQENSNNKSHIKTLETQLEHLEKKSRSCSIELRNIPKIESETKQSLIDLTKNIGAVLNTPIHDSDIRDVYRMIIKDKPNGPVIVDFNSTFIKENIIKSTITYNKEKSADKRLNTSTLKINGPAKPIYVAESLTKKVKRLHYLARVFAKENNYDSCWTSYGKVYLRRNKTDQRVCVNSEETLENLKSSF